MQEKRGSILKPKARKDNWISKQESEEEEAYTKFHKQTYQIARKIMVKKYPEHLTVADQLKLDKIEAVRMIKVQHKYLKFLNE